MTTSGRPHTSPPELAKDILGKLDNARAALERAQAVAARGGFNESLGPLGELSEQFERWLVAVQAAVRQDVRRLLSGPPPGDE